MNKSGGSKTTKNGTEFEKITSIEPKLLEKGFIKKYIDEKLKYGYYYEFISDKISIIYLIQNGFKIYFKKVFDITTYKQPDEAFIIKNNDNYFLKII